LNTSNKYKAINDFATAFFLLLFFLSFGGCKDYSAKDEHPEYFSAVFKKVDTTQNSQKDEALAFLDSAFNAFPNPGIGDMYSKDSIKADQYSFLKHDYIKAISYADSMMLLAKQKDDEEIYAERYAWALNMKADCFRHMKRYEEALHTYELAEQIVLNKVKSKCIIAQYDGSIALLMFAQEKYIQAAAYFQKQYNDFKFWCEMHDHKYFMNLEASLNNAALCHLKAGVIDSAWYYENAALNIIKEDIGEGKNRFSPNDPKIIYPQSVIYGDQAEVLSLRGKFADAEELYKKSIAGTTILDIPYAQSTQIRLAEL